MIINYSDFVFAGRASTALWAILKSLNRKGGKILLPVNICEIVYPIICKVGMVPVFYDVDEISGNATLKSIIAAYSGGENVLLAVHNFGAPLEIDRICEWAKEQRVFLIEDVCNSLGGSYHDKPLGSWGDAAIFSFGYAKIIEHGAGGAALIKDATLKDKVVNAVQSLELYSELHNTKNIEFQAKLRAIRNGGARMEPSVYVPIYEAYSHYLLYRIEPDHEEQIRSELTGLKSNLADRAGKSNRYRNEIVSKRIRHIDEVEGQIYWRYNLLVEPAYRPVLIEKLRLNELLVSTWYPPIASLFQNGVDENMYPGSRSFGAKVINLFVDYRVSQDDIERTVEIINRL
jgi:dTDP-4-amino-4,6-dideoxygalactose transaminase